MVYDRPKHQPRETLLYLLSWPLVHIRIRGGINRGPVKAWIAAGDAAIGLVFAFGGVAVVPVSVGGFAAGLLTMGGFGLGIVAFGGFSMGVWAVGGLAVGWQALGGCAIGWAAAQGGMSIAHDLATGAAAFAPHANDSITQAFMNESPFFRSALLFLSYANWLNLIWLLAPGLWWRLHKATNRNGRIS